MFRFLGEQGGLIKVTGTAACHCGLWTRCTLRKAHRDQLTGMTLPPGTLAYRPITNSVERGQRIEAERMELHAKQDGELMRRR